MNLKYPKVCKKSDGRYYVDLTLHGKRYRLFSGGLMGSSLSPNSYPAHLRRTAAKQLAKEVYDYLLLNDYSFEKKKSSVEVFDAIVAKKLSEPLSKKYKTELMRLSTLIRPDAVKYGVIRSVTTDNILLKYTNSTSFNTQRRHLNTLLKHLTDNGFPVDKSRLKARKQEEVLHKPVQELEGVLKSIEAYNCNLYLCCLLAYGCLLRPHREIRLLTWGDFSEDLSFIRLSGDRVKNKRNRIVPVPSYVREALHPDKPQVNIFSGSVTPFNESYFSNLWKKFKRNHGVEKGVTL